MKNVIIVSKGNTAVAVGDNNQATITKTGTGAFLANLEAIKEVMLSIPVEPSETVHLFVPDLVQGLVSGSAVEYVKTGKTASGNELTAEERAGFAEFYKLYAERILNVRLTQFKYIAKDNVELQNLRKKAWDALNAVAISTAPTTTQTIDPDKAIREVIDAQMISALQAGDLDKYAQLKAMRDELRPVEVITVANTTGRTTVSTPTFETDADKAFENGGEENAPAVDENGKPIQFAEAGQIGW